MAGGDRCLPDPDDPHLLDRKAAHRHLRAGPDSIAPAQAATCGGSQGRTRTGSAGVPPGRTRRRAVAGCRVRTKDAASRSPSPCSRRSSGPSARCRAGRSAGPSASRRACAARSRSRTRCSIGRHTSRCARRSSRACFTGAAGVAFAPSSRGTSASSRGRAAERACRGPSPTTASLGFDCLYFGAASAGGGARPTCGPPARRHQRPVPDGRSEAQCPCR